MSTLDREARSRRCRTIRTGALFPRRWPRSSSPDSRRRPAGAARNRSTAGRRSADAASAPEPLRRRGSAKRPTSTVGPSPPWSNDRAALPTSSTPRRAHRAAVHAARRSMAAFAISGVADRVGYLQRLAVDPSAQRRGLGRLLRGRLARMDASARRHHRHGEHRIRQPDALALYDTFGFQSRADPLLILERRLTPPGKMISRGDDQDDGRGPLRRHASRGSAGHRRDGRGGHVTSGAGRFGPSAVSAARPHPRGPVTIRRRRPPPGVQIELIDERYSFGPDESLHLVYRLAATWRSRARADTREHVPEHHRCPDTTVAPTTTSRLATVTIHGDRPAIPAAASPKTVPTTVPETTVPPPPSTQLTVEVANYPPLATLLLCSGRRRHRRLVGGDVDRDAFGAVPSTASQIDARRSSCSPTTEQHAHARRTRPTSDNSVEERLKFEARAVSDSDGTAAGDPAGRRVVATHGTIVQRLPGPADRDEPPPINLAVVTALPARPRRDAADAPTCRPSTPPSTCRRARSPAR